jgi:hypothetical protein
MGTKDQSSLNRYLTQSPWNQQPKQKKRLSLANQNLNVSQNPQGYFLIDDTINSKTGKHIEDAGYHFDSKIGKSVWGHDRVTTQYANGTAEYPARALLT